MQTNSKKKHVTTALYFKANLGKKKKKKSLPNMLYTGNCKIVLEKKNQV